MKATNDDILYAIEAMTKRNGYPPTVRELARALSLSSAGSLLTRLDKLQAMGFVLREEGRSRTLRVTRQKNC